MNEKNQAENQVSHVIEESEKEIEWVKGDQVEISYSGVKNVRGMNIALRQAGAKTIVGDDLVVRQGGFFKGQADKLSMNQAAAAILQTNQAQATGSAMGIILAQGDVTVDQGMARVVVGRNAVNIDQGGAFLIISPKVTTKQSGTIFLLASKVEGNVSTVFGTRESLIFGMIAGLVGGAFYLISKLLLLNREKTKPSSTEQQ